MGDVLLRFADNNPFINFLVLCGHTHHESYYQPLNNLVIKVGKSDYYQPQIAEVFDL